MTHTRTHTHPLEQPTSLTLLLAKAVVNQLRVRNSDQLEF